MNILFIPTLNSGVTYWRMYSFWEAMYQQGIADAHVMWWSWKNHTAQEWQQALCDERHAERRHGIVAEMNDWARQADVIIFQMVHLDRSLDLFYSMKEAYPDKPVLVEMDDNILSTVWYNPAFEHFAPGSSIRHTAIAQMKAADGIICSTPYLANLYSEFCPHTYYIPNSIDFSFWNRKRKKRPGIRVGWAGGASHSEDLEILRDIIPSVHEKTGAEFVIVHGAPEWIRNMKGVRYVEKFADINEYPSHLLNQDFDIGLAPIRHNAFNLGKSNLRWLEYSAMGVPTVASRVGHFAETIRHGEDGFLAGNPEEFEKYILTLIEDRKLRKEMGRKAQARVSADFNTLHTAKKYVDVLRECIARGQVGKVPYAAKYEDGRFVEAE